MLKRGDRVAVLLEQVRFQPANEIVHLGVVFAVQVPHRQDVLLGDDEDIAVTDGAHPGNHHEPLGLMQDELVRPHIGHEFCQQIAVGRPVGLGTEAAYVPVVVVVNPKVGNGHRCFHGPAFLPE